MTVLQTAGLSHSEIYGSKVICTYPKLIAAYHVLHRLQEPRHPPYALSYFRLKHTLYWINPTQGEYNVCCTSWFYLRFTFAYNQLIIHAHLKKYSKKVSFRQTLINKCVVSVHHVIERCESKNSEWRITDSNRWPLACHASALASWANPPSSDFT